MELSIFRVFIIPIDFFMCLFLWIVQLIIYPSFKYIKDSQFNKWHLKYMRTVGILIGPIMLAQIILIVFFAFLNSNTIHLLRFILLLVSWALTLLVSVPLHRKLESGLSIESSKDSLIQTNWYRTITWSLIFLSNFINN